MRIPTLTALALILASLAASPAVHAQDLESEIYSAARTCAGIESYLRSYPTGRFREDATARLARDCATPEATVDPCLQARADWAAIGETNAMGVLEAYIRATPETCSVQRTQAQLRLAELASAARTAAAERVEAERQAALLREKKRREWNGVPEFDGVWVQAEGPPCSNLPWRYHPGGAGMVETTAAATFELVVERTDPPTLRYTNGARLVVMADGRMRHEFADGRIKCYLQRR